MRSMQLSEGETQMAVVIKGCWEDIEQCWDCQEKAETPGVLFPLTEQAILLNGPVAMERGLSFFIIIHK